MGNKIYDRMDELPAAPRVDIPEAYLVLLEWAARAIGAVRVKAVDGEGFFNLNFADGAYCTAEIRSYGVYKSETRQQKTSDLLHCDSFL